MSYKLQYVTKNTRKSQKMARLLASAVALYYGTTIHAVARLHQSRPRVSTSPGDNQSMSFYFSKALITLREEWRPIG